MKKQKLLLTLLFLVLFAFLFSIVIFSTVSAQPSAEAVKQSTLTKVLEKKLLRVGVSTIAKPWGYLDDNYQNIGLDVELAKIMAKTLEVEIELVDTHSSNRVPFLVTGKVDVIMSSFSVTPTRALSVAFSRPYAPYPQVIIGRVDDVDFVDWTGIKARKVGVTKGGTDDLGLQQKAPEGTQIHRFETGNDVRLALVQGKIDAMSTGYVNAVAICREDPRFEIKGEPYMRGFPCFGLPLGDQVWLNWVNIFIENLLAEGVIQKLYEEHFQVPWKPISEVY